MTSDVSSWVYLGSRSQCFGEWACTHPREWRKSSLGHCTSLWIPWIKLQFCFTDYNPCINVSCPYYGVCEPVNGTQYSCTCVPCATNESEPLCDNKDKTHQSICTYKFKVCKGKEEPGIKHYGGCKRKFFFCFLEFRKSLFLFSTLGVTTVMLLTSL